MPLEYGQIKKAFRAAQDRGEEWDDMSQFAKFLAGDTEEGAQQFGAGFEPSALKDFNAWINRSIEGTGLPAIGGTLLEPVGGMFGAPEAGRRAGEALPRGVLNMVPLFLTGGGTLPATLLGASGMGGLTGLETYERTGSAGGALATGAVATVLPWLARAGGSAGLAAVGAPKVQGVATEATQRLLGGSVGALVNQRIPTTLGQRVAQYLGGQTAAFGSFGTKDYIEAKLNGVENPLATRDYWVESLIGQLPFAVHDVKGLVKKGPSPGTVKATFKKEVVPVKADAPVRVDNPEADAASDALLQTMKKKTEVRASAMDEGAKQVALKALDEQQNAALKKVNVGGPKPQNQVGVKVEPKFGPKKVTLSGKVTFETEANPAVPGHQGAYLMKVESSDDVGMVGRQIWIPKKVAKVNEDGSVTALWDFVYDAKPRAEVPVAKEGDTQQQMLPLDEGGVKLDVDDNPVWDPEVQVRKQAALEMLKTLPPKEPATSLEQAKAQLVAVDQVNSSLGNGVPKVSDIVLHEKLEQKVAQGATLDDAVTGVVEEQKARAVTRVEDEQGRTTRQVERDRKRVEASVAFGEKEAVVLAKPDAPEAGDVGIVNRMLEKYASNIQGRMLDFPDEAKVAYRNWSENAALQAGFASPGRREASLVALLERVAQRLSTGKVITGGKVLREDGTWNAGRVKVRRQLFADRASAEGRLVELKDKGGEVDWGNVKAMKITRNGEDRYYLMERPREINVEFVPAERAAQTDELTTQMLEEKELVEPGTEVDGSSRLSVAQDTLKEVQELAKQGERSVMDVMREHTLALTRQEIVETFNRYREGVELGDVDSVPMRIAMLNEGQAAKELPIGKWTEENLKKFNQVLEGLGVGFESTDGVRDFVQSPAVAALRRSAAMKARTPVKPSTFRSAGGVGALTPERLAKLQALKLDQPNPVGFLEWFVAEGSAPKQIRNVLAQVLLEHKGILSKIGLRVEDGVGVSFFDRTTKEVVLEGSFLNADAPLDFISEVVLHEVGHALSVDLIDTFPNHPAIKTLEGLRNEARNALPPELKKVLEKWEKEGLYEKHTEGAMQVGERIEWGIDANDPWRQVLYGLLNNHEFVSQVWSSNAMQRFLRGQETKSREGLWKRIVGAISKLWGGGVGDKTDLLNNAILATKRVFDLNKEFVHVEQIARERYVREGLSGEDLVRRMQQNGYDLNGYAVDGPDGVGKYAQGFMASFEALSSFGKGMTKVEMDNYLRYKGMDAAMSPEVKVEQVALLGELGARSPIDVITSSLVDPSVLKGYLDLAHPSQLRLAKSALEFARTQAQVLMAQELNASRRLTNLTPHQQSLDALGTVLDNLSKLHDTLNSHFAAEKDVMNMLAFTPEGFIERAKGDVLPAARSLEEALVEPGADKPVGAFWRVVGPAWQLAMEHPVMKPVVNLAFNFKGTLERARHRVFSHFATKVSPDGVADWNKETMQRAEKFFANEDYVQRVDKILLLRQAKKGFLSSNDPVDRAALNDVLQGLNPDQRSLVLEMADHQSRSMQEGQEVIVEGESKMGAISLAEIIHQGTDTPVDHAMTLSNELLEGVRAMNDPLRVVEAQQRIAAVRAQMDPERFLQGLTFAQSEVARTAEWQRFFGEREWFATEQRFDKWKVRARLSNGKAAFTDGPTREAALKNLQQLDPNATVIDVIPKEGPDAQDRLYGAPQKFLDKASELEASQLASLQAAGMSPEGIAAVRERSMVGALKRELAANQLYKPGSERQGVAGRQFLPMLQNHFNYMTAVLASLTKRLTRAEARLRLQNPDLAAQPALAELANQHIENFLAPDSPFGTAVTKGVAIYNLGFNFANHVVEASQSFVTHAAQLTAEGAGIFGGYRRLGKSLNDIMGWVKSGGKWSNPEHQKLMQQSTLDREIGFGVWDDSLADSDQVVDSLRQMMDGKKPRGVLGLAKSAVGAYAKLGANLYGVMTHFNARLALLSSFDFYRSKGMEFNEAYQKAREFNRTVNFSGGRAARPIGLFNSRGGWRNASQMVNSMRSYTLGMWATLKRNITAGYSTKSPLSYAERADARKATVQMLATMFAMAGAVGLPGVEAGIALAEQLTDWKLREGVREGAAKVFGDPTMVEGFLNGLPNMMGVDAHSRISLGGFPGLSTYEGFQLTDVLGPVYGMVERFAVGTKRVIGGDVSGAASYSMPPGFRKLADLLGGDGKVRGREGELLLEPTFGEKFALAVGFNPTRVSQLREADRIRQRSSRIDREESSRFHSEVAEDIIKGDVPTARQKLRKRTTEKGALAEPVTETRAIAEAVERRTYPAELLDKPGASSTLGAAYGMTNTANEVQRLQLRQHVMGLLGQPVMNPSRSLKMAAMVDLVLQQNPRLTRKQARALVESQL